MSEAPSETVPTEPSFARELWRRIETLHAVTYFDPGVVAASEALGLAGFWRGYFGFRAAPLGAVTAGVVEATFFNFEPAFVAKRIPEIWATAHPKDLLDARSTSAVDALCRLAPGIDDVAPQVIPTLAAAVERAPRAGRALFAANAALRIPTDDPVAALWQLCTNLREHRGDGHVAALTAAGIDGVSAHVLIAADLGLDPLDLQQTRGWSTERWADATDRLTSQGLITAAGDELTNDGRRLRVDVEATTDRLAEEPFASLDDTARERLLADLEAPARSVSESGTIRYPNPMGLPPLT